MTRVVVIDPRSEDPTEQARFEDAARLFDTAQLHDLGDSDAWGVDELRVALTNPDKDYVWIAAVDENGAVLGAAELILQLRDNTHLVILNLAVLPEHRRRGIGSAIFDQVERAARERGRRTIIVETAWRADAEDESADFARRHGFSDEQTMRRSDFLVTESDSAIELPPGYALLTFTGTPPETLADDRAHLNARMSTDAPIGDLEFEEQEWDAARVTATDERIARMDRGRVHAFAQHVDTGALVGFTEIQIPSSSSTVAFQNDTLVLREHRGHGLGLALKAAAAGVLRDAYPSIETVRTWNAVENEHMLAVNDALGYLPSGWVREWQKRL